LKKFSLSEKANIYRGAELDALGGENHSPCHPRSLHASGDQWASNHSH